VDFSHMDITDCDFRGVDFKGSIFDPGRLAAMTAALDRIHVLAADGQLRASAQRTILEQISAIAQQAKPTEPTQ
jgi:hypothetical protein